MVVTWELTAEDERRRMSNYLCAESFSEVISCIKSTIRYSIGDYGIPYECGSSRGCTVDKRAEVINQDSFVDVSELEKEVLRNCFLSELTIPIQFSDVTESGGCDGEHRGHCGPEHNSVEVAFTARLRRMFREKDGRLIAVYQIVEPINEGR